jgi:hypothetical protein
VLLTICTVRQLPQALTLGDSFRQFAGQAATEPIVIGLVDRMDALPADFTSPYPLIPVSELLPPDELATLSAQYTPTEFASACKPLFIAEAFRRYPEADNLVYADPNIQFLFSLTALWQQLSTANILLTPFITRSLSAGEPDEKFLQNIGLYSADFLAFRRSPETDRMLSWWDDRVRVRAYVNFCAGLCLDQIWLMHVPIFFRQTRIIRNPGWHVALWNLPERTLIPEAGHWLVNGPAGENEPVLFFNFKGLLNPNEGFFTHQNRLRFSEKSPITALLAPYRQAVERHKKPVSKGYPAAYGQQPEPPVLRGWRYALVKSMRTVVHFLDHVYLPAIR